MMETSVSPGVLPETAAATLPGNLSERTSSGHTPDLLNQKLWMWSPATCVLTSAAGDFAGRLKFENHCSRQNFGKRKNTGAVIYKGRA